jgi:hypothetical protein
MDGIEHFISVVGYNFLDGVAAATGGALRG